MACNRLGVTCYGSDAGSFQLLTSFVESEHFLRVNCTNISECPTGHNCATSPAGASIACATPASRAGPRKARPWRALPSWSATAKPKPRRVMSTEPELLRKRLLNHLAQMAPHQRERAAGKLLSELAREIERLDRLVEQSSCKQCGEDLQTNRPNPDDICGLCADDNINAATSPRSD